MIYKTLSIKGLRSTNPTKDEGEPMSSGGVRKSCSTSGTRRHAQIQTQQICTESKLWWLRQNYVK
jgi:hypothetical protein